MKKKGIAATLLLMAMTMSTTGCSLGIVGDEALLVEHVATQEESKQTETMSNDESEVKASLASDNWYLEDLACNFDTKAAIRQGEDGWVYFFYCEYAKGGTEPYAYLFEGYKLTDDDDVTMHKVPFLYSYEENVDDICKIQAFFNFERPTGPLTEEQTAKLSLENIDEQLVVELFNEAITSEFLPDGNYPYVPEANIWTDEISDGYRWQIGYFVLHGVIMAVDIEVVYEDGTYLSDVINAGNGREDQKKLSQQIAYVEETILSTQMFELSVESFKDMDKNDIGRILYLLRGIASGEYSY